MSAELEALGARVSGALPGAVTEVKLAYGELTLTIARDRWIDVATYLRDDPECLFVNFIDVTAADYPEREERFEVVAHFQSPKHNRRIRIKALVAEDTPIASIVPLFPGADWFERETYDLFGVIFAGHPDLRRIMTDYGFDGHPLRKDFPMSGFVEVRYDDERKRVVYEPVRLQQEYRNFDFLSPWEAVKYDLPGDEKASK
ncbi:NADH-quinone oxidoreductase subunit C [Methylocystis sp. MJC1]|jgi:NADH-quinone oxidoreductase subunit C|uniref:NADH-quinone oxidoreductase subunit C n=1 Tax=Methylocystis sp. MJC1 TaxID=2654282 RepID=UPI0013EDBADD|nr:NADH-quinone oxidoreductase subunit C [Methylocystis sp. MJC1]KAF2992413.1 NADH-quinone oxidoreductase chain 5 [Methylocystis sp. MJC1]MBU6527549.1 NADH-quinone oxidoreductase subunit C [Methylocystis sp. MJC1]UZX10489.1 NADH-quinone oxidoreductase subunit C [Methylocystis sp. MJC1]